MRCFGFLIGCWFPVSAWRTSGTLPALDSFAEYVGKFCFDFKPHQPGTVRPVVGNIQVLLRGRVRPTATAPRYTEGPPCYGACKTDGRLYLMVFDDEEEHGELVRQHFGQMSCEEMIHSASWAVHIQLETTESFSLKENITEHLRPRFWYFIFAACGAEIEVAPYFEIHAQNVLQGFETEFGMDQQGSLLLQVSAASGFMGIFWALRLNKAGSVEALRARPLLQILLASAGCSSVGACCFCLHWAVYASDGRGLLVFQVLGTMLVALGKASLSLLQLLLAKGWGLFYSPQQLLQRQIIMGAILLMIAVTALCELHEVFFHDWSARIYMYEDWTGLTILALNCLLFLEAWRSMRDTFLMEDADEVRRFYVAVSLVSILYFLSLPLVCLLATLLSPHVRAKYVDRCEVGCRFTATMLLGYLLRPSRIDHMVNARMQEPMHSLEHEEAQIVAASGSVPRVVTAAGSPTEDERAGLPAE